MSQLQIIWKNLFLTRNLWFWRLPGEQMFAWEREETAGFLRWLSFNECLKHCEMRNIQNASIWMTPGWLTTGKLQWQSHLKDRCVESWVCRKLASDLPYESHECVRRAHSTDDKAIWWKHTRMHRQYLLVHSLKRVEKNVAAEKKENKKARVDGLTQGPQGSQANP